MSTLTTAFGGTADPSSATLAKYLPVDIDNNPILLGDNPAHIHGALHEVSLYFQRTGEFEALLQNRAVLLSNGKLAVESATAALFVSGSQVDPEHHDFDNPCPPIAGRTANYDAHATLHGGDALEPAATMPAGYSDSYVINQYAVASEDRELMNCLRKTLTSSDLAQTLISGSQGSGTRFLALLQAEAAKTKP